MKMKVTEQQLGILKNTIIKEVNRSEDYTEDYPVYDYKSVSVLPNENNPKNFLVFFNGNEYRKTDYIKPNESPTVIFDGPQGYFEFDKEDIKVSKNNDPYISSFKIKPEDRNIFYKLIKSSKLVDTSKLEETQGIQSWQIRKSLELAFPSTNNVDEGKWYYENPVFSAGVRGVYTIGEKLNTDDDWSILNYFDTKKEIRTKINSEYSKSGSDLDIVTWFVNELKNKRNFIGELVDRQWKSIEFGFKTEELAKNFINGKNARFYPSGSKMDRYEGVDVTIDGINYQIKPLTSYSGKKGGPYTINTYGMKDYKTNSLVDKILFVNPTKMLEFDNKDYTSTFDSAIFINLPTDVKTPLS